MPITGPTFKLLLAIAAAAVALRTFAARSSPLPARPAWSWSTPERIAERLDPASIRARVDRNAADRQATRRMAGDAADRTASDTRTTNVIVGRENPELFLPFELYPQLVSQALSDRPDHRRQSRERLAPIIGSSETADAFWRALEASATELRANEQRMRILAARLNAAPSEADRSIIRQQLAGLQKPGCAMRAAALRELEARVGRDVLYRVLYEGIAPELSMESREEESAARLLFIEGGCQ